MRRTVALSQPAIGRTFTRRLRNPVDGDPDRAALAVCGLTAGTQTADAFVTAADHCGGYIYGYQYWGNEHVVEYERAGEETPYAAFVWNRVVYYGHLITVNNC
jgi:hypothetical protein